MHLECELNIRAFNIVNKMKRIRARSDKKLFQFYHRMTRYSIGIEFLRQVDTRRDESES